MSDIPPPFQPDDSNLFAFFALLYDEVTSEPFAHEQWWTVWTQDCMEATP